MTITPDGIDAAANREKEFHPTTREGKPITAWERRARTLKILTQEVNRLSQELALLKKELNNRPF